MELGNKSPDLRSLLENEDEIEDVMRVMENFPYFLLTGSSDQSWLSDSDSCDTLDLVDDLEPMTPPPTPVKPVKPIELAEPESPITRLCQPLPIQWNLSFFEPSVKVEFQGLRKLYEKTQSRVNKKSRQRVEFGKLRVIVTSEAQIQHIDVHVERIPKAAALFGDNCGPVRLHTHKYVHNQFNKHNYSVDLDSVYMTEKGVPVYKLSTVDAERRNQFRIVVRIIFLPDTMSRPYYSPPFLLRSRKTSASRRSSSCSF